MTYDTKKGRTEIRINPLYYTQRTKWIYYLLKYIPNEMVNNIQGARQAINTETES